VEIGAIIAPAGFHLKHPELHHYTSLAGAEGILRSRVLWATHFEGLNDRSEVTHLKSELTSALAEAVVPVVNQLRKLDRRILGESRSAGGPATYARRLAATLVDSFYQVAFTGEGVRPMAVPFIASFCSHAGDQSYERENGLLSQWRGYGEDGGCCIVFDTPGLISLLQLEWEAFYWVGNGVDDVVYATADVSVASRYPILVAELTKVVEGGMRRGLSQMPLTSNAIATFLDAATRFKHQGFKEEREVRIVAIPGSAKTADTVAREHTAFTRKPIKDLHDNPSENRGRPYVALFDTLDAQLPIKRIIVGPSRRQDDNFRRAIAAAGHGFPLVRSKTPFVG
jgi:hypothetical protein